MWLLLCVAMETRAAALQAQIGSWKKKTGKRKKEIEKEGVFQLELGRKVVPIVRTSNAGSLFNDRFTTSLPSKTFNIIYKRIWFGKYVFLSLVFWRHSCTPCTSWSAVDPIMLYAYCVHSWRFISMVTAPSVNVHFRSEPVDGDVESRVTRVHEETTSYETHPWTVLLIQQQFGDLKLRCYCKHWWRAF